MSNSKRINPLKQIVKFQKQGISRGIYSVCSANEYVIEAAIEKAMAVNSEVLIEATANQVNQYGGYTGMKPKDFREFVFNIAKKINFPFDRILLGGDHLGPLSWKNETSDLAMQKAAELIRYYIYAGFTKIHIDTSVRLRDDDPCKINKNIIAMRSAILCKVAEDAFKEYKSQYPDAVHPVYVIGSEVPVPGGKQKHEKEIKLTSVQDFEEEMDLFKKTYLSLGLNEAWENVVAVVVQPGVEFDEQTIHEYNRKEAKHLLEALKKYTNIVFEGHSTDYQPAHKLKQMVEDGIAILKVGPALTFALREALFALNYIENELLKYNRSIKLSRFIEILDEEMLKNPAHWKDYYQGSGNKLRLSRKYGLSDRCRYYLTQKEVKESIKILINNLKNIDIPLPLISQYMPLQYIKIKKGLISTDPEELIKDRIANCMEDYIYATIPEYQQNINMSKGDVLNDTKDFRYSK